MNKFRAYLILLLSITLTFTAGMPGFCAENDGSSVRLSAGGVLGANPCGVTGGLRLGWNFFPEVAAVFEMNMGRASASASAGENFAYGLSNDTIYNINTAIDMRLVTSVSVFFSSPRPQGIAFFGRCGIGAAFLDARAKMDVSNGPVAGTYHGETNFSGIGPLVTVDIVSLRPSEDMPLSLAVGARALRIKTGPKTFTLWNGINSLLLDDPGVDIVYPEVFVSVEF
jgi:hypothetical protein